MKKTMFFLLVLSTVPVIWAQSPPSSPASISDGFVLINGGTFTMGSPSSERGRDDDEGPQHQVTISSFFMSRYEVTQKEYQEVMGTNPSSFKGDNLPVENISWYDAVEYCNKRSLREGLAPAYMIGILWWAGRAVTWDRNADGYRLPTEAEWEYACRAGTTTAYNTGASISANTGWYAANSGSTTHPVGQKPPNAWGLYDMHGNVWEWCWDCYGAYSSEAQIDPQVEPYEGAPSWLFRVRRGGGWYNSVEYLRSATRYVSRPHYHGMYLGFRIARNAR